MNEKFKKAIETYQCSGCVCGSDISCYEKGNNLECDKHVAGTIISGIGRLFLGMPKGFNRLGVFDDLSIQIFETFDKKSWEYNEFNIPVWKWLNSDNHTFIRGICPRTNIPFLHVVLEDCLDKIDCYLVSDENISKMY